MRARGRDQVFQNATELLNCVACQVSCPGEREIERETGVRERERERERDRERESKACPLSSNTQREIGVPRDCLPPVSCVPARLPNWTENKSVCILCV